MNYTPTILIGVGGLGSTIVNNIYAKLHPDMLKQTVILAMDTDVNWIKSLKNLPDNNIIQTSQNQTVEEYIYNKKINGDTSIESWFQTDILELGRKQMTDGAGQVRGVSRLALRGSIENREMQKVVAELSRINTQTSSRFVTGVRVCLVGSLAGGTGSGMFLQIALMVRKILADRFNVQTVMSIGYFLLGGVLEGCGKITGQEEVENINANTYACFKELNALTVNASSSNTRKLNIQFEYDPNSNTSVLSNKDLPFDYYHIIDHLNLNGKNLGNFEDYLTMMSNNIFVYLFSPIASGAFSKLDNQILGIIRSMGQNRVCGSAAGRLVFPYEDVLRLFSIKRTVHSISEVWTKFDELYEVDMREYKRRYNQGDTKAEKPLLRRKYIFYLESAAKKQKADPNFVLINNQLNLFDENKEVIGRKSNEFLREVDKEIVRRFENDERLNAFENDGKTPKSNKLVIPETATGQIANTEKLVKEIEMGAREFLSNNKLLARNILFDDEGKNLAEQKVYMGEKHYLNYWILNNEPMHPIAARIFLYEVINDLEDLLPQEKIALDELKEGFNGQKNKYKEKSKNATGKRKDSPQDALNEIVNQPIYKKLLFGNKQLKEFSESYINNFRGRSNSIKEIAQKELQISVYETLITQLKQKVNIIEEFFLSLNRVIDRFHLEQRELSQKYEYEGGYDRNILSKPKILELLWKDKENQLVSFDEVPEDLSKTIYFTFYDKFCEKANNENLKIDFSDDFLKQISEQILQNNARYIADTKVLDLDIIEAIRQEGRLLGKSKEAIDKYLAEKLVELKNLVQAFGPDGNLVDKGRSSFYSMWGVNESVDKFIPQQLKNELEMEDSTAASFIVDERFDKREIIRSKILMGQSLNKFLKFYHGDTQKSAGPYYTAYKNRIADLQNSGMQSLTPHLDKRWHLPNYLPEIFPELNDQINTAAADTLIKGLVTHTIAIKQVGGVLAWTANHQILKDSEGKSIASLNINSLLFAIFQNPQLEKIVHTNFEGQLQKDRLYYKKDYKAFQLLSQSENIYYPVLKDKPDLILDVLLNFFKTEEYRDSDKENGMRLLKRFRSLIEHIIQVTNATDAPMLLAQKYEQLMKERFTRKSDLYAQLLPNELLTGEIKSIIGGGIEMV